MIAEFANNAKMVKITKLAENAQLNENVKIAKITEIAGLPRFPRWQKLLGLE